MKQPVNKVKLTCFINDATNETLASEPKHKCENTSNDNYYLVISNNQFPSCTQG